MGNIWAGKDDSLLDRVLDPYSFYTDLDPGILGWIQTWIQGFYEQKLRKNLQLKFFFFVSKTTIYPTIGLYKERPSSKRSIQIIQHLKKKHEIS